MIILCLLCIGVVPGVAYASWQLISYFPVYSLSDPIDESTLSGADYEEDQESVEQYAEVLKAKLVPTHLITFSAIVTIIAAFLFVASLYALVSKS